MYDATKGREMSLAGIQKPDKMIDQRDKIAYLDQQRELVAWSGQCETKCDKTELVEHFSTGILVCPRTLEPCQKHRLQELVKLYSRINK